MMNSPQPSASKASWRGLIFLLAFFVVSRLLLYVVGIRFDISPMDWFFQILDHQDLKANFWQSLFYLHTQPPGFNFLVGSVLNLCPGHEMAVFSLLYFFIGLGMAVILYSMMIECGVGILFSLAVSVFFVINPSVILMENWLFYSYPTAFMLLLSSFLLLKYVKKRSPVYGFLFFFTLWLVVMTRSLFHLLWYIFIFIWIIMSDRARVRQVLLYGAIPLLLICGAYLKNYIVFKHFGLSSWMGMNLIKMTFTVPEERIKEEIEQGNVSDLALVLPFQEIGVYQKYVQHDTVTGIPVLDKPLKSTGAINFNYIKYVSLSDQYLSQASSLIRKFPLYYGLSVLKAFYGYLQPCSDSIILAGHNRRKLGSWVSFHEDWITGSILRKVWSREYYNRQGEKRLIHINFLFLLIPVIYGWGIFLSSRRSKALEFMSNSALPIQYMVFNILYSMVVGNFLEFGENMRFRFLVLPFIFILGALCVKYCCQKDSIWSLERKLKYIIMKR